MKLGQLFRAFTNKLYLYPECNQIFDGVLEHFGRMYSVSASTFRDYEGFFTQVSTKLHS